MRRAMTTIVLAGVVLFGGCQRSETAGPGAISTTSTAERLDGWDDVNNVYRAGDVFIAGQPGESGLLRFADEGVGVVVNMRRPEEMQSIGFDERRAVEALGMRYVSIPVTPATLSPNDVERFAAVLEEADGPVLLHCGSANRAGGLWAAYLARERGLELDAAMQAGESAGMRSESVKEAARRVATAP